MTRDRYSYDAHYGKRSGKGQCAFDPPTLARVGAILLELRATAGEDIGARTRIPAHRTCFEVLMRDGRRVRFLLQRDWHGNDEAARLRKAYVETIGNYLRDTRQLTPQE